MNHRWLIRKTVILLAAMGCCFGMVSSATSGSTGVHDRNPEEISHILSRITPSGWVLASDVRRFDPNNLWEQINGYAEFFLSYDVTQMTLAIYQEPSNDQHFIEVAVYDMGNPTNAFGVFRAERPDEQSPLALGREGYQSEANFFIWKGNYYIRIIATQGEFRIRNMAFELAKQLTGSLVDKNDPVQGLSILPETGRVPGSVRFFRRNAMGLDFMQHTFTARYIKRGVLITVFSSQKQSAEAARQTVIQYAEYAQRFGKGASDIVRGGVMITLCDMDGSYDALFQKDLIVAGVTAAENRETAIDAAYDVFQMLSSAILLDSNK